MKDGDPGIARKFQQRLIRLKLLPRLVFINDVL